MWDPIISAVDGAAWGLPRRVWGGMCLKSQLLLEFLCLLGSGLELGEEMIPWNVDRVCFPLSVLCENVPAHHQGFLVVCPKIILCRICEESEPFLSSWGLEKGV